MPKMTETERLIVKIENRLERAEKRRKRVAGPSEAREKRLANAREELARRQERLDAATKRVAEQAEKIAKYEERVNSTTSTAAIDEEIARLKAELEWAQSRPTVAPAASEDSAFGDDADTETEDDTEDAPPSEEDEDDSESPEF